MTKHHYIYIPYYTLLTYGAQPYAHRLVLGRLIINVHSPQAPFPSSATQLFAAQLLAHEKTFPPDPRLSSQPEDHMPRANCNQVSCQSTAMYPIKEKIHTIAAPRSTTKKLKIVRTVVRFVENHLPLYWYNHRQGGMASVDVSYFSSRWYGHAMKFSQLNQLPKSAPISPKKRLKFGIVSARIQLKNHASPQISTQLLILFQLF
jgi:hypothetical protein